MSRAGWLGCRGLPLEEDTGLEQLIMIRLRRTRNHEFRGSAFAYRYLRNFQGIGRREILKLWAPGGASKRKRRNKRCEERACEF